MLEVDGTCHLLMELLLEMVGELKTGPSRRLSVATRPPRSTLFGAKNASLLSPIETGRRGRDALNNVLSRQALDRSLVVAGRREPAVEVVCGTDEREVRERLREVAEVIGLRPQLLAVQPQMIGVAQHLLEEEARLR